MPDADKLSPEEMFALAVAIHRAGDLDSAERRYRQILETDARHASTLHLLGVLIQQRGRPAEAVPLIRMALEQVPDQPVYLSNLGEAYRAGGDFELAAQCCRRSIELDPRMAEAHNNLGLILSDQGRAAEAMAELEIAIELNPYLEQPYDNLANVLRSQGRMFEAAAFLSEGVRLIPGSTALQARLTALRRQLGS